MTKKEITVIWYSRAEAWFGGYYGTDNTNLIYQQFYEIETELDAQVWLPS